MQIPLSCLKTEIQDKKHFLFAFGWYLLSTKTISLSFFLRSLRRSCRDNSRPALRLVNHTFTIWIKRLNIFTLLLSWIRFAKSPVKTKALRLLVHCTYICDNLEILFRCFSPVLCARESKVCFLLRFCTVNKPFVFPISTGQLPLYKSNRINHNLPFPWTINGFSVSGRVRNVFPCWNLVVSAILVMSKKVCGSALSLYLFECSAVCIAACSVCVYHDRATPHPCLAGPNAVSSLPYIFCITVNPSLQSTILSVV